MNTFLVAGIILSTAAVIRAGDFQQCEGNNFANLKENVVVSNCLKSTCKLKKGTKASVEIKFTPEIEVKTLTNTVNANIVGIPFPFIGVDGTDACPNVYLPDGTKPGCPLKAGQQYLYKNEFEILEIYPRIKVVVHWGLKANNAGDVICFEVPARITN